MGNSRIVNWHPVLALTWQLMLSAAALSLVCGGVSAADCFAEQQTPATPSITDRINWQLRVHPQELRTSLESQSADTIDRNVWQTFTHDISYAAGTFWSDTKHIYSSPARINTRSALWLGGIAAVGGVLYAFDQEILDALVRNRHEFPLKQVVDVGEKIEWVGDGNVIIKYIIATMGASYLIGLDPLTSVTAEYLETYYLTSSIRQIGLTFVGRTRPRIGEGPYNFEFDEGGSFPSGHMSNFLPLAKILAHRVNHWAFSTLAYSLVATTGIQRITSFNHWPSDVYVSAVYSWLIVDELLRRHWDNKVQLAPSNLGKTDTAGLILVWRF